MTLGLINKILPFSSVDGPGNRMIIFLQGCSFNCLYCHNPETINLCCSCGGCIAACPSGALSKVDGMVIRDSNKCVNCDTCLKACRRSSSPKAVSMTVQDVMQQIIKVKSFLSGITVSGGECTLQSEFLTELFKEVHRLGLTAFVDTNGSNDFEAMTGLSSIMDAAMLDIKSFDDKEHRMLTGRTNDIVIRNAQYLARINKLYEVRTVIVPELLNNSRNVDGVSRLIASLNPDIRYKIIKYRPIGVRHNLINSPTPSAELMEELKTIAKKNGCKNVIVV